MAGRHAKLKPVAPVAIAGSLAFAATAIWTVWPTNADSVPTAEQVLAEVEGQRQQSGPAIEPVSFDMAAFHAPLWVVVAPEPVAPPPPAPPPPAPPPPLRASLLAIARDASHAVLHDQDADRVVTLRVGDTIQRRTVTRIEPSRVTLAMNGQTQTLELGYAVRPSEAPR
ncbi:MAG: hypothetical protein KDA05_11960 [Phycisphaerales bacterium]|nr:hypothetical protein [Phycisphaerales bacterium]